MRALPDRLLTRTTQKCVLASAAVLVLGGSWLFLGVLEVVISGDPLVQVDALVYEHCPVLAGGGRRG